MSKELKKPVLLMAQANREAVKNRKKGESPELHDLAESDGVGQNATRVLSLSVIDGTLKISIKKNRYGINNKEVLMIWEVNTGYLKPLLSENPEESTEDKKDDKPDGEHDKGGEKDYRIDLKQFFEFTQEDMPEKDKIASCIIQSVESK